MSDDLLCNSLNLGWNILDAILEIYKRVPDFSFVVSSQTGLETSDLANVPSTFWALWYGAKSSLSNATDWPIIVAWTSVTVVAKAKFYESPPNPNLDYPVALLNKVQLLTVIMICCFFPFYIFLIFWQAGLPLYGPGWYVWMFMT